MADRPLSVAVSIDSLTSAANVPLPADDGLSLHKPSLPFLAVTRVLANEFACGSRRRVELL